MDPTSSITENITQNIDAKALFAKFVDSKLKDNEIEDFVELQYLKAFEIRRKQARINQSLTKKLEDKSRSRSPLKSPERVAQPLVNKTSKSE